MKRRIVLYGTLLGLMISCTKSEDDNNGNTTGNCDAVAKSFVANVGPLIQNTCTSSECHGSGSKNGPGPLLNYSNIFAARADIRSAISNGSMPKNSSLSSAQKNTIICWIDSGAPNN